MYEMTTTRPDGGSQGELKLRMAPSAAFQFLLARLAPRSEWKLLQATGHARAIQSNRLSAIRGRAPMVLSARRGGVQRPWTLTTGDWPSSKIFKTRASYGAAAYSML